MQDTANRRTRDADERQALAKPWALPLLESLLRREMSEAKSPEMSDWYIDLMEEVEQEFRRPLQDFEVTATQKRCADCSFADGGVSEKAVRGDRTLK